MFRVLIYLDSGATIGLTYRVEGRAQTVFNAVRPAGHDVFEGRCIAAEDDYGLRVELVKGMIVGAMLAEVSKDSEANTRCQMAAQEAQTRVIQNRSGIIPAAATALPVERVQ